jgi:hypothetical protein
MADYDLVVRGGTVVTGLDSFRADIGISGGRVVALAETLDGGAETLDASGLLVMPGGVDTHCHIEQLEPDGTVNEESFVTGSTACLAGGTTSVITFASQFKGHAIRDTLDEYRRRAAASAMVDYSFHQIITDPTEDVVRNEIPALVESGIRSLKVFLTYDPLNLNDAQYLRVLAAARRTGALVTVHCENYEAIRWRTAALMADGRSTPEDGGTRGHAPRHRAGRAGGPADPGLSRLLHRGGRGDRPRPGARSEGMGRDLPAIFRAASHRHGPAGLRRGQVHVQPQPARPGRRRSAVGGCAARHDRRGVVGPLRHQLRGA